MRHLLTAPVLRIVPILAAILACGSSEPAQAQQRLQEGFDVVVPADPAGEEITAQSNMWMLEVSLKPMRMIWVDVTNPETGKKEPQLIWYLVYKAVPRPLPQQQGGADIKPVNDEDVPPPPMFVPEFTLVTNDEGAEAVHQDVILPEAQVAINRREKRVYKNPVEIAGQLPQPTPEGQESPSPLYGIAMWRAIDPDTDHFTVYMTGFSSGYQLGKTPDGGIVAQRKTIEQQFWRPGDRFDATEIEIRRRGAPRWIYRADEQPITVLGAIDVQNAPAAP
jgi:hypothetical protein